MTRVAIIISDTNKSFQFEWLARRFKNKGLEQHYVLLKEDNSELEKHLKDNDIIVHRIKGGSFFSSFHVFFKLLIVLRKIRPTVVHCHLLRAALFGSICSYLLRIEKRVITRHHSDFHRNYAPRGKKWDRLINKLSTHIVAISKNVQEELMLHEGVSKNKISLIHHGLDFERITVNWKTVERLKLKYSLNEKEPIVGAISRYEKLKGLDYIIEAFRLVLNKFPNAKLVLANANGSEKEEIQKLLHKKLKQSQFIEIEFEPNIFELYKCFDVFIHAPINNTCEAFGQTYIEPLAMETPSVFSLSGVANEFIVANKHAIVVPHKDSNAIAEGAISVLNMKDTVLKKMTGEGKKSVLENFDVKKTVEKHIQLYLS